jgi:glutamyl-Q tRNA(Asp) synthetase
MNTCYIGRFAPSPSGRLHFGSLVAAVASYCDAHSNKGKWLVRIDDLDPPREVDGAADDILRTLDAYSLKWDDSIIYQSLRHELYASAIERLREDGLCFGCACSRSDLEAINGLKFYPGTCRTQLPPGRTERSVRFIAPPQEFTWQDTVQGTQTSPANSVSDFIVRRADGHYAYHLAAVVDDADSSITHIVRGLDLLTSTHSHILLQSALHLQHPQYAHVPLVINTHGLKLSKLTNAAPIEISDAPEQLSKALSFLGLTITLDTPERMLAAAVSQWDIRSIKP